MRWTLSMLAVLASFAAGTADARGESVTSGPPAWMAGCWEELNGDRWTEECWTDARAGIMLGTGRSSSRGALREWEATQILTGADGKPIFWASPNGGPRVDFPMVSQGPKEILFANPEHDYPQRIRYWLDGGALNAETSLMDGSKGRRWTYKRAK